MNSEAAPEGRSHSTAETLSQRLSAAARIAAIQDARAIGDDDRADAMGRDLVADLTAALVERWSQ